MKKCYLLFCGFFMYSALLNAAEGPTLLTFDDLPTSTDWTLIQPGYGGLHWYYFGALNGSNRPDREGYRQGTISPDNVAFNIMGSPAELSSAGGFTLLSAYLTAATVDHIQVQAQGWRGATLVYSNTLSLSNTPAFINFGYVAVDRVAFVPSTHSATFAMDNVLIYQAPIDLGNIQITTVGHEFEPTPDIGRFAVRDSLICQRQTCGGGGITEAFSADFDTHNQFILKISAPAGQKFLIQPPSGQALRIMASLNWQGPYVLSNGPSLFGMVSVRFGGLEGVAPDFADSRSALSQLHGFVGFTDVQSRPFSNTLAFTSLTLTATVPSAAAGSGTWTYTPSPDNALTLYYETAQTNDPGRLVSILPDICPVATIRVCEVEVCWQSQVDRVYRVEFRSTNDWERLAANIVGTGGTLCVPDRVTQPQRIYRVVCETD